MAIQRKYPEQMPFVVTPTQAEIVNREAEARGMSKAAVVREAFDAFWGLVDGEPADGHTVPTEPVRERQAVTSGA